MLLDACQVEIGDLRSFLGIKILWDRFDVLHGDSVLRLAIDQVKNQQEDPFQRLHQIVNDIHSPFLLDMFSKRIAIAVIIAT